MVEDDIDYREDNPGDVIATKHDLSLLECAEFAASTDGGLYWTWEKGKCI